MKTHRLASVLFLGAASLAQAGVIDGTSTSCSSLVTLQDYINLPATQPLEPACAIGIFDVFDVTFIAGGPLTASNIAVVPFGAGTPNSLVGLSFNANFSGPATYEIRYKVDPPPEIILGYDLDLFGGSFLRAADVTAAALVSDFAVTVNICTQGDVVGVCVPGFFYTVQATGNGPLSDGEVFAQPTRVMDVQILIDLAGGAAFPGFNTSSETGDVPEPSGYALLAGGISALALLRRGRRRCPGTSQGFPRAPSVTPIPARPSSAAATAPELSLR